MKVEEIERITSSNEFWGLSSGDHLNMIDTLLEKFEEAMLVLSLIAGEPQPVHGKMLHDAETTAKIALQQLRE